LKETKFDCSNISGLIVSPFPRIWKKSFTLEEETKMQLKKVLPALIASTFVLAACSTTTPPEAAAPTPAPAPAPTPAPVAQPAPVVDPLQDPNSVLAKRSVYFDFDRSDVKPEFQPMVTAHADYLVHHKDHKVVIQGNTDERGSREYNLALGQRRAEAVRKSLSVLGVPNDQMEAVSFGKEKPKALGHDEASWAENRRADIVYQK
jgi:peptidoglycan-associated lipoprotein